MTQHNFQPTDDGSQDHINPSHEWTSPLDMTSVQANQDQIDAARAFQNAPKNGPAPVDVNEGRRVFPVGPREHGATREGGFHPSPTLNPLMCEQIEGYEEFQDDLLPLRRAMDNAFTGLSNIATAREKLRNDPTVTPAAAVTKLVAAAESKHNHIVDTFSKTEARLRTAESALEKALQAPVTQLAGLGTINDSIRAHVKGLDETKRSAFMQTALKNHDETTLVAVCGAPAYLSGLSDAAHALFLRQLHEMRNPEGTRRLKSLRAGIALLERAVPIALTSVEKALGSSFAKAKQLKGTSDASAAALAAIMGPQE